MSDKKCDELGNEPSEPSETVDADTSSVLDAVEPAFALSVVAGCDVGKTEHIEGGDLIIGRWVETGLQLEDPGISKRHCRIYRDGPYAYLEDLDSTNGTVVNGELIDETHELEDGDAIALGEQTLLRVSVMQDDLAWNGEESMGRATAKTELVVGRRANWFKLGDGEPVDLRRRGSIRKILRALLEQSDEDAMLSVHELFNIGWPDQSVDPDLAAKRVYWAIRTLRDEGLRGFLITSDDGYYIPAGLMAIEWRPTQIQPPTE